MNMKRFILIFIFVLISLSSATQKGFGPGEQDYGYVTVRSRAHMFWWLFHTTADVSNSTQRPLMLWLQGGPGVSSTGYGNFEMIGPLNLDLKPRKHTWVKDFNVLFVDSPVGTGYSYVELLSDLTTDNTQIAKDLVALMKGFYEALPQFKTTPLYVHSEAYGGKMAVEFVRLLVDEVKKGNIESNISGVAIGNAWISPVDTTLSWGPFLYQVSLVDEEGENAIEQQANYTKQVFDKGFFFQATNEWCKTLSIVNDKTGGVNFYNIHTKTERGLNIFNRTPIERTVDMLTHNTYYHKRAWDLLYLMNGPVRKALSIPWYVIWGLQSTAVFDFLSVDFMKPVTHVVESLLNETDVKVYLYNGNLDLICDTPGQMQWIKRMRWHGMDDYNKAKRKTIWVNNIMEGSKKSGGKFTFFWINVAGHNVPGDNPAATSAILESLTGVKIHI